MRSKTGQVVASCLLLGTQALATTSIPRSNEQPLAAVDIESHRKHVFGSDGIDPNASLPVQHSRYSFPTAPATLSIPSLRRNKKWTMEVSTHDSAGYAFVDSTGQRYLQFALLTLGNAEAAGGLHTAQTWYRLSKDGGKTFSQFKQVIARGTEFSAFHPLPGVRIGTNGYQFPGNSLIVASNDEQDVLLPLEITPLDSDGNRIRPHVRVTTYSEVRILRGHWRSDGSDLDWELGQPAQVAMSQSTRGLDETAIVELSDKGRCLIVSRGSNQNAPDPVPPGHYWLFESRDGCRTWAGPGKPLGWDDGSTYYAPAAPPFLYEKSDHRALFIGAHSDTNSKGNLPRTRVVAAELDPDSLTLIKRSAVIIDEQDRFDTPSVDLIFSNFWYLPRKDTLFYYMRRADSGYCIGGDDCAGRATSLPGKPPFPRNWHLLKPMPASDGSQFTISADPTVINGLQWHSVPDARKLLIYARNPAKQNFWQLNGEVAGGATSYALQALPMGRAVTVNVFAVLADDKLSSSNRVTLTIRKPGAVNGGS